MSDVSDAFKYIVNNNSFFILFITVISGTLLARSIYDILPMIVEYLLGRASQDFVYISFALGLASLFSGIFTYFKKTDASVNNIVMYSLIAQTLITSNILFNNFYFAIILLGISSFFFVLSGLSTLAYIHQYTPERYKGKVISIYYLCLIGGSSLGTIIYSALYELGIGKVIWLVPSVAIVLVLAMLCRHPDSQHG